MAFLLALVDADEGVDTMDAVAENAAKCLHLWEICEGGSCKCAATEGATGGGVCFCECQCESMIVSIITYHLPWDLFPASRG